MKMSFEEAGRKSAEEGENREVKAAQDFNASQMYFETADRLQRKELECAAWEERYRRLAMEAELRKQESDVLERAVEALRQSEVKETKKKKGGYDTELYGAALALAKTGYTDEEKREIIRKNRDEYDSIGKMARDITGEGKKEAVLSAVYSLGKSIKYWIEAGEKGNGGCGGEMIAERRKAVNAWLYLLRGTAAADKNGGVKELAEALYAGAKIAIERKNKARFDAMIKDEGELG